MFVRTVKVPSSSGTVNEYVRIVESYRDGGRVKQRTIADLGRRDLLARLLPQLERILRGDIANQDLDVPREEAARVEVLEATTWGPVLVVRALLTSWVCGRSSTNCSAPATTNRSPTALLFSSPIV